MHIFFILIPLFLILSFWQPLVAPFLALLAGTPNKTMELEPITMKELIVGNVSPQKNMEAEPINDEGAHCR